MSPKVVYVDQDIFELENGEVFQHPFQLSEISLEQFQIIVDHCPKIEILGIYLYNKHLKEDKS
jgi:hypothetical protein